MPIIMLVKSLMPITHKCTKTPPHTQIVVYEMLLRMFLYVQTLLLYFQNRSSRGQLEAAIDFSPGIDSLLSMS